MFEIERNNALTIFLMLFIAFTFLYRYWDVFFKKYSNDGKVYFSWTLYLLAIIHSLIGIFSACEYLLIKRQYNIVIAITALTIFIIGQIIRNAAIFSLKEFHSTHIEIKPNHQLIQTGLYKWIRHPYYFGVILEVLSTPLILNSYFSFVFSLFVYLPILFIRIYLEEQVLKKQFGERYIKYAQKVPRFLSNFRFVL